MTLFLHIGMSKAGSTAIQKAIVENNAGLQKMGIIYPKAGRIREAHFKIVTELRAGVALLHLAEALNEAKISKTIVISAEGFWLITEEEVLHLREELGPLDTQIVLYLRRPADYLCSSYRQGIKGRKGKTHGMDEYLSEIGDRMNYPRLLDRWGRHFPLRVRAYEAVKSNIEADFMSIIGASPIHAEQQRRTINKTPSDGSLRLMLMANKLLPKRTSKIARHVLLSNEHRLRWMKPMNNAPLHDFAAQTVSTWKMDIMRKYLSKEDLLLLTTPSTSGRS